MEKAKAGSVSKRENVTYGKCEEPLGEEGKAKSKGKSKGKPRGGSPQPGRGGWRGRVHPGKQGFC